MIFNPGLGSGGGGKPELLFKRITEKSSDVQRFDLTGVEWDKYLQVIIYVNAKRVSSSAGFAFDLDGASWSTTPYLCAAAPAVPAMAVIYPFLSREVGGIAAAVYTSPKNIPDSNTVWGSGINISTNKTLDELTQLSVYGISYNMPVGTTILVYGIP